MPIFDQGYQHWHGTLSGHGWRWLTITRHGVRAQMKNRLTRFAMLVAWMPAITLASVLIVWGLFEQKSSLIAPLLGLFRDLPSEMQAGPSGYRTVVWTIAYQWFFVVQVYFAMFLVLLVGPNLVSQDLRFNAMPLYFSRPLRRIDYFMGKLGVIGVFLGAVAVLPALIAWVLGVLFSMDWTVITDTGRLLGASLGYGLVIVLSAGMLMLAISSLSRNSRYVAVIWFGFWMLTMGVASVLEDTVRSNWCPLLSYTGNLRRMAAALLDTRAAWQRLDDLAQAGQRRFEAQMEHFGRTGPDGRPMPPPDPRQQAPQLPPHPRMGHAAPPPPPDAGRMRPTRRTQTQGDDFSLTRFADAGFPWSWSAGVLAGLFGLSLWILTSRVRSLDRLR